MNDLYFAFAQSMSDSNNITLDQAMQITEWLEGEGALDIPVLKDTYGLFDAGTGDLLGTYSRAHDAKRGARRKGLLVA